MTGDCLLSRRKKMIQPSSDEWKNYSLNAALVIRNIGINGSPETSVIHYHIIGILSSESNSIKDNDAPLVCRPVRWHVSFTCQYTSTVKSSVVRLSRMALESRHGSLAIFGSLFNEWSTNFYCSWGFGRPIIPTQA